MKYTLVRLASRGGRSQHGVPVEQPDDWVRRTKSIFGLEILNTVLIVVVLHTGRQFSLHFSAVSFKPMRGFGEQGGGSLATSFKFVLVC